MLIFNKNSCPIAVTAYDYPTAKLLEEAGIDLILVGDSLGMVVLGHPDTTEVTMADMVHHTRAVVRAATLTTVAVDLPAGTYDSLEDAIQNSRTLIEAGAQVVKLEGGVTQADVIKGLVAEGIPVMAHIGMLPQRVRIEGGYRVKGKNPEEAESLLADALAVEQAGACCVVLELIVPEVAAEITRRLAIPTLGIGSGEVCDGEIRVFHDLVGLFPWFVPGFMRPKVDAASLIKEAISAFVAEVKSSR